MQVHTFISESANEAVEQIRAQLGASAVVLSVRKLPPSGLSKLWSNGQIEVIAGVPEAPLEPARQAEENPIEILRREIQELKHQVALPEQRTSRPDRTETAEAACNPEKQGWQAGKYLVQTGLLPRYAERLVDDLIECHGNAPRTLAEQFDMMQKGLRSYWRPAPNRSQSNVHIFVGAPGVGKSTALCKWMAQVALLSGTPACVLQLDTCNANPSPLPPMYSEILGTKFDRSIPENLGATSDTVFVDLPGVSCHSERDLSETMKTLARLPKAEVHLVLNGAYEAPLLLDQVRYFSALPITDLIVTHLDEETRWGKLWNLVFGTNFCLRYLSSGQNIPGDFAEATAERLLARQFRGK